jgi:hypothetical protein
MLEIEANVPVPSDRARQYDKPPVAELEVRQSLFFPVSVGYTLPQNQAQYLRPKLGRNFTIRKVEEIGELAGWRMWRIK